MARFHEVDEAAWASDNDVDAIAHCFDLLRVTNTAVHSGGTHTDALCKWSENIAHLVCKFASRNQHKGAGGITLTWLVALEQTSNQRKCESKCLARSSTAAAKEISASEGISNGCLLNREWSCETLSGQFIN
jgi:hypothetical protein